MKGAKTDPGPGPWDLFWCDPAIIPDCPGHDNHQESCPGYRRKEC